jgi:hypothetical protein
MDGEHVMAISTNVLNVPPHLILLYNEIAIIFDETWGNLVCMKEKLLNSIERNPN